jgi:hypothetical protein
VGIFSLAKFDTILKLLEGQPVVLEDRHSKAEANVIDTLSDLEATVAELEFLRNGIADMAPEIIKLENAIASETDAAKRTALKTKLTVVNPRYNAMVQDEQVKPHTLGRYIEKGKTLVESLQNQAATQMVLINKLQMDTKQGVGSIRCAHETAQNRAAAGRGPPHQRHWREDGPRGAIGHGRHRFRHHCADGRDDGETRRSRGLCSRRSVAEAQGRQNSPHDLGRAYQE